MTTKIIKKGCTGILLTRRYVGALLGKRHGRMILKWILKK
jgi:hypothetical protein